MHHVHRTCDQQSTHVPEINKALPLMDLSTFKPSCESHLGNAVEDSMQEVAPRLWNGRHHRFHLGIVDWKPLPLFGEGIVFDP